MARKTRTVKRAAAKSAAGSAMRGKSAKRSAGASGKGEVRAKAAAHAGDAARASKGSSGGGGVAYIALMRGINVGGNNRIAMADLVKVFEAAGCSEVRTYIQSGNVAFRADGRKASGLAAAVTGLIEARHGLRVPVVMRRLEDLRAAVAANPFLKADSDPDPDTLHVMFLADEPAAERVRELDAGWSPGDSFEVVGREIFLLLPRGLGETKLINAYFDRKLKTLSTGRNWRTVMKLLDL